MALAPDDPALIRQQSTMKIDKTRFLLLATTLGALVASCDSHPADEHGPRDPSSPYPACDAIIKACHEKDVGGGPVNACHEIAHGATSDDACIPKKDECIKTCNDAVVGGPSDAGPG